MTVANPARLPRPLRYIRALGASKWIFLLGLVAIAAMGPTVRAITAAALADAYLQVSVFVALTLGIIYMIEARTGRNFADTLRQHRRWQIPIAAFLGALPGCGGAVAVVTQYVQGSLSFGALVAVLTATMGDAAFLLLAAEPLTGLGVFVLGGVVGILSGYAIDAIHGPDFMRMTDAPAARTAMKPDRLRRNPLQPVWAAFAVPGLVLGLLSLLQVDTDALFGPLSSYQPTLIVGLIGAVLSLAMWLLDPSQRFDPGVSMADGTLSRVVNTTNFVTLWVVVGFLVYELGIHFTGVDLAAIFDAWAPIVPALAVIVGFLPGCGPQIVVTTLYLNGALPLSAQLGNAISNDGDALFPAIAIAPRAAIIATLYSAIPAILVAYTAYWLLEV